ncbi:dTDP-4-dehydrorhamnose reductase, partial [bacterium]
SWAVDMLERHRPWGVVNAIGYEDVDAAEGDIDVCWRENASGPIDLAMACAERGLPFMTFSDGMVFDGEKVEPYVESDPVCPINVYGQARASAERAILRECPEALVIRSGLVFGPQRERLVELLRTKSANQEMVSLAYLPHLVEASLDLMLDGMTGVVHLANAGSVAWNDFAREIADVVGLDAERIGDRAMPEARAPRPKNASLRSERAWTMPTLEDAIERLRWQLPREASGVETAPYLS